MNSRGRRGASGDGATKISKILKKREVPTGSQRELKGAGLEG